MTRIKISVRYCFITGQWPPDSYKCQPKAGALVSVKWAKRLYSYMVAGERDFSNLKKVLNLYYLKNPTPAAVLPQVQAHLSEGINQHSYEHLASDSALLRTP
jgi:hypothetical protein